MITTATDTARHVTVAVDVTDYGCVRCQRYHDAADPLYGPHLAYQSRHGVRRWTLVRRFECRPGSLKEV